MILLDTHVVIWLADEVEKLSKPATHAIRVRGEKEGIGISAITLFEVAWLIHKGRVQFPGTLKSVLAEMSSKFTVVPIDAEIAALATELPDDFPGDPGDRLIAATALSLGATLITRDEKMREYARLSTIW